jgi:hypothetical protein
LKPAKPPFTYILVWRIVVVTAEGSTELRSKTETIELGSFDYEEFNQEAILLAARALKTLGHRGMETYYRIYRGSPTGKVNFQGHIFEPTDFQAAEDVLRLVSRTQKVWSMVLTTMFTAPAGGSSYDQEEEEEEGGSSNSSDDNEIEEVALAVRRRGTKRKRSTARTVRPTTTKKMEAKMEAKMEERRLEELKEERLWGTRIAKEYPCNLREKCPWKGDICLNHMGKHSTVVPAIVRIWIDEDSTSSKKIRSKYDNEPPPPPPSQPIIYAPAAPPLATAPAALQSLGIQDILQAVLINKLIDGGKQSQKPQHPYQYGYSPYMQHLMGMQMLMGGNPWLVHPQHHFQPQVPAHLISPQLPPQTTPIVAPIDPASNSALDFSHKAPISSVLSPTHTLPTSLPKNTSLRGGTPTPHHQPHRTRTRTPPTPQLVESVLTEEDKMVAFFSYVAGQVPHQAADIDELQLLLCDEGFSWKVLSITLRTPNKGMAMFRELGVKAGFVLLMAGHISGFKKYCAGVNGLMLCVQ